MQDIKNAERNTSTVAEASTGTGIFALPSSLATATPQPTESVTATIQPPKAETGTTEQLKNGDLVQDDNGTAKYEILDTAKKEVAYKEPVNKKVKTVTISATVKIGGVTYKVTGIADGAFKGNNTVTKITVGSNVASIGQNVFNGCKKLKTIMIKSTKLTAKTVSRNAYKGLTKATSIKVPKKKLKEYKKLFKSKGLSSKVKVKGY